MGLDISSVATGVSIMQDDILIHVETIKASGDLYKRQAIILKRLRQIVELYKPETCGIEDTFQRNVKTIKVLEEMHGICITVLIDNNINFKKYQPTTIKSVVAGKANSEAKEIIQKKMIELYNLPKDTDDNSTDSIAIALTHLKKKDEVVKPKVKKKKHKTKC